MTALWLLALRNWRTLLPVLGILAVLGTCWGYVAAKNHAISVAQSQRNAAVLDLAQTEVQLIVQSTNVATLDAALTRQSASLRAAGQAALATQRATEENAQRASQAAVATDRTIAQLRAEAAAARARGEELCAAALRIGRGG